MPLVFLTLSLLGLTHRAEASDFFIRELKHAFPGTSLESIIKLVRRVQDERGRARDHRRGRPRLDVALVLQRARVRAQHRLRTAQPPLLHGKVLAAVLATSVLVTLFVSLVVGAFGVTVLKHHLGGFADSSGPGLCRVDGASLLGVFVFLFAVYYWLPNTAVRPREALPGAILGAVVLEASFQALPIFVRLADVNVTLRTLGGPAILLLWLYVVANVFMIFGGELNWWWRERQREGRGNAGNRPRGSAPGVIAVRRLRGPGAARGPRWRGGSARPSSRRPARRRSASRRSGRRSGRSRSPRCRAARSRSSPGGAGAAQLSAVRREEHQLRDVVGAAVPDSLELAEQLGDRGRAFGRIASGRQAGRRARSR